MHLGAERLLLLVIVMYGRDFDFFSMGSDPTKRWIIIVVNQSRQFLRFRVLLMAVVSFSSADFDAFKNALCIHK